MDSNTAPHDDPAIHSDTESAHHDEPGDIMVLEPALNDNLGTNLDSSATRTSRANEETIRCVNCGVDLMHRRRHTLQLIEVLSIIRQWTAPQVVTAHNLACHSCWTLALNQLPEQQNVPSTSSGHRRELCVSCKCSIRRTRSHILNTNSERETHIRNVISEWIAPQQVHGSDRICHPCWQRADRVPVPAPAVAAVTPTINLPNYTRAPDTQTNCFYPDCESTQRLVIPTWLRVKLFTDFNFYVPKNCRICRLHLLQSNWDELLTTFVHPCHSFTAEHIQDFASFVKERNQTFDFQNIEEMNDDLVHYWIGLSKEQFINLKAQLPRLSEMRNGSLALTAYLIKLRTGDSDERISTLLNIARSTLSRLMSKARDILNQDFVPGNLGIGHITREEIAERGGERGEGVIGNRRE